MKELNGLEKPRDHKIIDIWLLVLLYTNGESMRKSIEKVFKKKVIEGCIQEVMLDQCIYGNKELAKVSVAMVCHEDHFNFAEYISETHFEFIFFFTFRNISCPCFLYLSTYWHAKNKRQGILAFTCILFFLKSLLILIQDRK